MPMHVGIIGAGNIGGNLARRLALAGHDVTVSFARDQARLAALAAELGAIAGEPSRAAAADVVVLSVPWDVIDTALAAAGPLTGRIVVDTTNKYGRGGAIDLGHAPSPPASTHRRAAAPATGGSCGGSAATTPRPRRSWVSWWTTPAISPLTSA